MKDFIFNDHALPVIVIGTSAGGLNALNELVAQLEIKMNAAVFIVMHLSNASISDFLVHRLQHSTKYTCKLARHGERIVANTIYISSPDTHLMTGTDRVIIGNEPRKNRWRSSIDVLFRSAASIHGSMVTGIILTGMLDDGAAGMDAIRRCGGKLIVQDPNEAEFPDMPMNVLNRMEVDYCLPLAAMGNALTSIISSIKPNEVAIPEDIIAELKLSERNAKSIAAVSKPGKSSLFVCPDCGGHLWELTSDKLNRFRCDTGHTYSESDLVIKQTEMQEDALRVAVRIMEERRKMLLKINEENKARGLTTIAKSYIERASILEGHIEQLKDLLNSTQIENYETTSEEQRKK